jgi:hypothetical protein
MTPALELESAREASLRRRARRYSRAGTAAALSGAGLPDRPLAEDASELVKTYKGKDAVGFSSA